MQGSKGLIQVYTGDGKGKTTAAMGLALRALAYGNQVTIIRFMKCDGSYGEAAALKSFDGCNLLSFGREGFVVKGQAKAEDKALAQKGLAAARQAMDSCDLLILDEVNNAVYFDLLSAEDVLSLLKDKPTGLEVVLTGRNAAPQLLAAADLITEMRSLRHPFDSGAAARQGIEY